MPIDFIDADIGYGDAIFKGYKEQNSDRYYQTGRLHNRVLLDFGVVQKNDRTGMHLLANNIKVPCLLKSLHAPSPNETNDTFVMEVHNKPGQGVQERFFLQYYSHNEMPIVYPEFILMPDNVVFVIPNQVSRVLMVLEPINLMSHATALYTP